MASQKRHLSQRMDQEVFDLVENFRKAQIAIPSRTEAMAALIRLGFNAWKEGRAATSA